MYFVVAPNVKITSLSGAFYCWNSVSCPRNFYLNFCNAKGNQRRPLNYDATSATLLPAVWLTRLLAYLFDFVIFTSSVHQSP